MTDFSTLPSSLFVEFTTRRLTDANVGMANHLFTPRPVDALFEDYRYIVPSASVESSKLGTQQRTFLAERYNTMGHHGGGARVGTDDTFQIKGIGCTPLLSARFHDFAYSNGEKPLGAAIREMIWSEVLHASLPYGAT